MARASAALNGNDRVESEDLAMGVRLCIAPRGTQIQAPPDDEEKARIKALKEKMKKEQDERAKRGEKEKKVEETETAM